MNFKDRFCIHCGNALPRISQFCGRCGNAVEAVETEQLAPSPSASKPDAPLPKSQPETPVALLPAKPKWIALSILLMGIVGIVLVGMRSTSEGSRLLVSTDRVNPLRPMPQPGNDTEGDWVSDPDEDQYNTSTTLKDTDNDGLTDFEEIFVFQSDPLVMETDNDGDLIPDIIENNLFHTDPTQVNPDRDGDGVPDILELQNGSDPDFADTDGDILSDFLEVYLTNTDPAVPDPITANGFPEPFSPWLPQQFQNSRCEVLVNMTLDKVEVLDAEEADSASDIIEGDEPYLYYGFWINALEFSDLDFDFNANRHAEYWEGSRIFRGDTITRFNTMPVATAQCGDDITWAINAYESDAPWGGVRNFGLWRDERRPIIFHRLPIDYWFNPSMVTAQGSGGDGTYHYDIYYSPVVEMVP